MLRHLRPSRLVPRLKPQALAFPSAMSSRSQSSTPDPASAQDQASSGSTSSPSRHSALPAPHESGDGVTTLDVSGDGTKVKLGALGPMVVNQDGTISRISNWEQMADIEKESAVRIVGKRNQQRLAALRQAQGISENDGSDDSNGSNSSNGRHNTTFRQ